mgnify:CR=1 FL=1
MNQNINMTCEVKWEYKKARHYKLNTKAEVVNSKTEKIIPMKLKGYTRGYYLQGDFVSLKKIKQQKLFEKIPGNNCPF